MQTEISSSTLNPRLLNLLSQNQTSQLRLNEILNRNFKIDEFGLIIPKKSQRSIEEIVVKDLVEARYRMQHVMLEGKTVIYFPGAFDLVHIGHASYIDEGISQVMKITSLKREQLFVIVLADSDDLIEASKPAHLYARDGHHPRPIESEKILRHVIGRGSTINPRLIDLAQLDIDMVGLLPSPHEAESLLESWTFKQWFAKSGKFQDTAARLLVKRGIDDTVTGEAQTIVEEYDALVDCLENEDLATIIVSFDCIKHALPAVDNPGCWTLPAWQLLLHRFLGMVHKMPNASCYRILSERDSYCQIVERLMSISNIQTAMVNDTHLLSTTALLREFGWRLLYEAKVRSFKSWA